MRIKNNFGTLVFFVLNFLPIFLVDFFCKLPKDPARIKVIAALLEDF